MSSSPSWSSLAVPHLDISRHWGNGALGDVHVRKRERERVRTKKKKSSQVSGVRIASTLSLSLPGYVYLHPLAVIGSTHLAAGWIGCLDSLKKNPPPHALLLFFFFRLQCSLREFFLGNQVYVSSLYPQLGKSIRVKEVIRWVLRSFCIRAERRPIEHPLGLIGGEFPWT